MKKNLLLLIVLALYSSFSFAQKHKHKKAAADTYPPPPRVWVANIHTYYTTKDSILAKPELSTDSVGCRVSGFTISLQAPGKDFYGPLYSNTWEMTEMQKNALRQWNSPNTTIYIQDIHLNCHEKDATSPAFKMMFDR